MRKFFLENEYAQRYDLHQPSVVFFNQVSGLGASVSASYTLIGDTFINTRTLLTQQSVIGNMCFLRGANQYQSLQTFSDFVYSAKKLYLIYNPSGNKEYRRDVDLVSIAKGEIDLDRVLRVPVQFICKSLYYTSDKNKYMIITSDGDKTYTYSYPVRYNDNVTRTISINNDGHTDAPFDVEVYGYANSPKISIIQDGKVISEVVIPAEIQIGEKIIYSTRDGDLQVTKVTESGETNLISLLDGTNNNFCKLPVGESVIKFTSDTGLTNDIVLQIYKMYKVV